MKGDRRNYELTVILGQDIAPSQVEIYVEDFIASIKKLSGEVVAIDRCGLRSLAYEIDKNKRGHYIVFKLSLMSDVVAQIDAKLRFDKYAIRYLFVHVETFGENRIFYIKRDDDQEQDSPVTQLIDYKNPYGLRKFLSVVSKISSRRITRLSMKEQREVAKSIARARFLALLSYGI